MVRLGRALDQASHEVWVFQEIVPQQHFNIHTLFKLQAGFQPGSREKRAGHGLGDSFRAGPIINYGLGRAEIHVVADYGHGEAFLAEQGAGLTGQILVQVPFLTSMAVSTSSAEVRGAGAGRDGVWGAGAGASLQGPAGGAVACLRGLLRRGLAAAGTGVGRRRFAGTGLHGRL